MLLALLLSLRPGIKYFTHLILSEASFNRNPVVNLETAPRYGQVCYCLWIWLITYCAIWHVTYRYTNLSLILVLHNKMLWNVIQKILHLHYIWARFEVLNQISPWLPIMFVYGQSRVYNATNDVTDFNCYQFPLIQTLAAPTLIIIPLFHSHRERKIDQN